MVSDPFDTASRAVASFSDYIAVIGDFVARDPDVLGGSDIYLCEFAAPPQRAAALIVALLRIGDAERRPAIRRYIVIAPPEADIEAFKPALWDAYHAAAEAFGDKEAVRRAADWLAARIEIVAAPDRRTRSVLDVIEGVVEATAVVVCEAAGYRDDSVHPFVAAGAGGPLQPEDFWVPQLHHLASEVSERIRGGKAYVAFDTDRSRPEQSELRDLLLSIDGCGVLSGGDDESAASILARHVGQWDAWVREGRLGRALSDIEALPAKLAGQKSFLRAQMLHRAGFAQEGLQAIRDELAQGRSIIASSRVKLARIAADAGAGGLAREVLVPAITELMTQEELQGALAVARDIEAEDLIAPLAERLGSLFPGSPALRVLKLEALRKVQDFAGLASEAETKKQAALYRALQHALHAEEPPDYLALIASDEDREFLRISAVDDAMRRQLFPHAFALVRAPARLPRFDRARDQRLLEVLEALFLRLNRLGRLLVNEEDVRAALASLIRRLAENPREGWLRGGLSSLLQPSVAGRTGLAYAAMAALDLASRPLALEQRTLGRRRTYGVVVSAQRHRRQGVFLVGG